VLSRSGRGAAGPTSSVVPTEGAALTFGAATTFFLFTDVGINAVLSFFRSRSSGSAETVAEEVVSTFADPGFGGNDGCPCSVQCGMFERESWPDPGRFLGKNPGGGGGIGTGMLLYGAGGIGNPGGRGGSPGVGYCGTMNPGGGGGMLGNPGGGGGINLEGGGGRTNPVGGGGIGGIGKDGIEGGISG